MAPPTDPAGASRSTSKSEKDSAAALKKVGKYEIIKKIGAGGMGAVYLATDPFLKRNCALKVLPHEKAKNPTLLKRFRSEAQQAANLRHENIVSVYEAGEADGVSYIAMEYVEGTDVSHLVQKRGVVPLRRSIEIIRQVAHGLDHALEQGIVHRDIKPGNILLRNDGVAKLADLGLARSLDDVDTAITRAGTTVGTVDYMSPEQARDSKAADLRSDIYSLGCTWYYMLTGEAPFPDGSLSQKLRAHAETPLPDPRKINESVTENVYAVIRRMTEKQPSSRYQTPRELLDDLDSTNLLSDSLSEKILEDAPEVTHRSARERGSADHKEAAPADEASVPRKKSRRSSRQAADDADSDSLPAAAAEETRSRGKSSKRPAVEDQGSGYKPPPGRDAADKSKLLEPSQKAKSHAAFVYAVSALAVVGLISAVIYGFNAYNEATTVTERMANPFAHKNAVSNLAGTDPNAAPGTVGGTATGTDPGSGSAQPPVTNVVGTAPPPNMALNPADPLVGTNTLAPQVTRIGGDPAAGSPDSPAGSNIGSNPAVGAGNAGTGTDRTGNSGSPGGATASTGAKMGGSSAAGSTGNNPNGKSSGNTSSGQSASSGNPGAIQGGAASAARGATGPDKAAAAQAEARHTQESLSVPVWARQARPTDGLTKLLVGAAGSSGDQANAIPCATLNEAFDKIPAAGAVIQLVGNGPFHLESAQIADKGPVIIEPHDPGSQPAVLLMPSKTGPVLDFLTVRQSALELRKIHLMVDASAFKTSGDAALLLVAAGDLSLKNCSISVKGTPTAPITAVKISGKVTRTDPKAGGQPRVVFDQTVIRGNNLTALLALGEHLDLTTRDSLLWSGQAPVIRFGTVPRSDADSNRIVRLVSSTLCSLNTAISMGGEAGQPVPTGFELLNSLIAAPQGSQAPVLFLMEGWSSSQQKLAFGKFLTWKSTNSLLTGWTTLLQLNPSREAVAQTPDSWKPLWKDKEALETEQIQSAPWPGTAIADATRAPLNLFVPQSLGKQPVKTADGGWPGCDSERLVTVNVDALAAAEVATHRPVLPRDMFNQPVNEVLTVDINKQDLGKIIEVKKPRTGMTIKVVGAGRHESSPIVLENVWVRMIFEQTDGAPLMIVPRAGDSKRDGLITVKNGGLQIDRGVFSIPATERTDRGAQPKWLFHIIDSDLGLMRCRLQGPLVGTNRNKGLIRWESETGLPPARPFKAPYHGYTIIQSSFLIGSGTLIDADMRRRALIFHNSVLVAREDLCNLNLSGPDSHIGGAVDVRYSTFSAVDHIWRIQGAELGAPASEPLQMFADRSVFGLPLRTTSQKPNPIMFSYSGPVLEQKQVQWWENRCGHSPEVTRFLLPDATEPPTTPQSFDENWLGFWGVDQILEPCRGNNGVVLQKELPSKAEDRQKLEPEDFKLHQSCRAAAWEGGRIGFIGAYIESMAVPPIRGPAIVTTDKKRPVPSQPAPTSQQGF
ncbi:MAG: protein kinase [Planctomycetes bacterium]|nr:protein kinase [Planctomycetota bacterium]